MSYKFNFENFTWKNFECIQHLVIGTTVAVVFVVGELVGGSCGVVVSL